MLQDAVKHRKAGGDGGADGDDFDNTEAIPEAQRRRRRKHVTLMNGDAGNSPSPSPKKGGKGKGKGKGKGNISPVRASPQINPGANHTSAQVH